MKNILVPIDPTRPDRTRSAIAQVVQLGREELVTARLLRVQPRVTQHVAMCFAPGELHAMQEANGLDELAGIELHRRFGGHGQPHHVVSQQFAPHDAR